MYFKDNKLISKDKFLAARKRASGTKTARKRQSTARKSSNGVRRMKKSLPHPSVTGMASGLAIAAYLNAGKTVTDKYSSIQMDGVIKDITDGQLGAAFSTLSSNAVNMISTDTGRKTLVTAGGIAALGAFARRQFPQLKLGGSKLYFRI